MMWGNKVIYFDKNLKINLRRIEMKEDFNYLVKSLLALLLNSPDVILGKVSRKKQLEWFISDVRSVLFGWGWPVWEQKDWDGEER